MSITKFFLTEDFHFQPKLTRSKVKLFSSSEQLLRAKSRNQCERQEISIPLSFTQNNSGITVSKQSHCIKFKFTEFMVPGDALLQKTSLTPKI